MFSPQMDVRQISSDRWMLLAPLVWNGADWRITVPSGFVTDFASIPRPLWVLWPKSGSWNLSAVLHDFECRTQYRPYREVHARFLVTLTAQGVGLSRWPLYLGVSQFGPSWNTYRLPDGSEVGPGGLDGPPAAYVKGA